MDTAGIANTANAAATDPTPPEAATAGPMIQWLAAVSSLVLVFALALATQSEWHHVRPVPAAPPPQAFTLFRSLHDADRAALVDLEATLAANDLAGFQREWSVYERVIETHARLEDETLIPLLVGAFPITAQEGYDDEHHLLHAQIKRMSQCVDLVKCGEELKAWRGLILPHLKREEELLSPRVAKIGATPEEKSQIFSSRVMSVVYASDRLTADFDALVTFMLSKLAVRGSPSETPLAAVRSVVHALWSVTKHDGWSTHYYALCKSAVPPVMWAQLVRALPVLLPHV